MKRTCWVITKDLITPPNSDIRPATNENAVGMVGPRNAYAIFANDWNKNSTGPLTLANMISGHPSASRFRLRDDDNIPYYEGFMLLGDDGRDLAPLDDFGSPNAGCTEMEIQEIPGGPWKQV